MRGFKKYWWWGGIVVVELLLFWQYRAHESDVHFFLHSLVGVIVALLIFTILMLRGRRPRGLMVAAFGLHQYAMLPDYLYQLGYPHQPWMNLFLGHLWVDELPYHDWILSFAVIAAAGLYLVARRYRAEAIINPLKWLLTRAYRAQVAAYADYWRQLGEAAGAPALVYAALGDSAAQGIGATSPARGYVGLVAEKLRQASGRPVRVINLSRSGAVIADVFSDQLPRLTALKPDVVTVAVGGNDVWRGASLPELEERFGRLAAALPAGSILADVPCFGGGQAERKVQAISPLVEQLCREHDLVFAPLHQTTHPHHRDRRQYARDWFHPSDAGYVVWAQALWAGVERQLNANDRSIPKHAY